MYTCIREFKNEVDTHGHEVVQFAHAAFVQAHDGRVRQPVEDLPSGGARVARLGLEELLHELLAEHGGDDVRENLKAKNITFAMRACAGEQGGGVK